MSFVPPTIDNRPDLTPEERENSKRVVDYCYNFLNRMVEKPGPIDSAFMEPYVHPDIEFIDSSLPEPCVGFEAFKAFLEMMRQSFETLHYRTHNLYPHGDKVTAVWTSRGRMVKKLEGLKTDGGNTTLLGTSEMTYKDGKVIKIWQIFLSGDDEISVEQRERNESEQFKKFANLTQRERDVYLWICEGKANDEIATILGISPRTISKHCQNLYRKLGVDNRKGAMVIGILHNRSLFKTDLKS